MQNTLSAEEIRANLTHTDSLAVTVLQSVESTNRWLHDSTDTRPHLCITEQQTAGRGRRGKQWLSEQGSFTCSIRLPAPRLGPELGSLSLALGVVLNALLVHHGAENIGIKWPNDVLYVDKKLAGLLLETTRDEKGNLDVIVGLGINHVALATSPDQPATAWQSAFNKTPPNRNLLAANWFDSVLSCSRQFAADGFTPFCAQWRNVDLLAGQEVSIIRPRNNINGVAQGVNETGELLILTNSGETMAVNAGEVSVRPC